jgi:ATP-dependent exoDNAse (exonuclease V) alpha subunit
MSEESTETISIGVGCNAIIPPMDFNESIHESNVTSQMEALYYMFRGDNILLCGQAGTGKSWVIQVFRNAIDTMNAAMSTRDGKSLNLAVTASTGAAASLINGQTIHSWSGLGRDIDAPDPDEYDETGTRKIIDSPKWKYTFKRIKSTDILIIDEVSMIPAYFLTNLDKVCRMSKHSDKPFGGIQVIMVGDYLQLPPVSHYALNRNNEPIDGRLCFYSPSFRELNLKYCYLDCIHRSDDDRLNSILNAIRSGTVPKEQTDMLMTRMGAKQEQSKSYTRLYTKNRDVNSFNKRQLDNIRGSSMLFKAHRHGPDYKAAANMQRMGNIPDELELKVGAIVMLTSNSADREYGHVNGSMGKITGFNDGMPRVMFNDGIEITIPKTVIRKTHKEATPRVGDDGFPTGEMSIKDVDDASVEYIPLKLAWAITVHKSQGQTLDGAIIDLSDCFQRGLGYVAISRVHSLDDIVLQGKLPKDALMLDNDAFKADRIIRRKANESRSQLIHTLEESQNKETMLPLMKSKERKDMERWLKANPTMDIISDDYHAYEWMHGRAKRHGRR